MKILCYCTICSGQTDSKTDIFDVIGSHLGPDDAVDGLTGRVPDGAAWECLLSGLGVTLVTLELVLHDDGGLAEVPRRPTLHQGHLSRQAHPVHVVASLSVV